MSDRIAKDILAEQAVLSSIFNAPESIDDVIDRLNPEDFYEPRHEIIYNRIIKLRNNGDAFDPVSLASSLKRDGLLTKVGGVQYLTELLSSSNISAYSTDPIGYAEIVKDNSKLRKLYETAEKILDAAASGSGLTAAEAIALAESSVLSISQEESVSDAMVSVSDMFDPALEEMKAAADRPEGVMPGIPSGFPDFDAKTSGFRGGQMCIIAARPGIGKLLNWSSLLPVPVSVSETGYKTVADIQVGDQIFGIDGKPYNVTGVHPMYELDAYEVVFNDGTKVIAGADHEWYTETRVARKARRAKDLGNFAREQTLPKEKIQALEAALAETKDDDTCTLLDLAKIVGYPSANPTMINIASMLPTVGQVIINRQIKRNSKAYKVADVSKVMLENEKLVRIHEDRLIFNKVATLVNTNPDEVWTVKRITDELFGEASDQGAWYYINSIIINSKLPKSYIDTIVEAPLKPSNLYNKKELLTAYLKHATSFKNDQRDKSELGSVKTTLEIMKTLKVPGQERWNHSVPIMSALELPEAELPVQPYSLGAWLGDGYSSCGNICGIDHEVFQFVEEEGYEATQKSLEQSDRYKHKDYRVVIFPTLRKALKEAGLLLKNGESVGRNGSPKHIPAVYLRSSVSQRKALLAGLMDTDGTCTPKSAMVQFSNSNKRLIDDVWELVCSLGYAPKLTERVPTNTVTGKQGQVSYTISWSTTDDVFRISRKIQAHREGVAAVNYTDEMHSHRYIVDVKPVGKDKMRCISVDAPNNLYATGRSFIMTHNSTLAVDFGRAAAFMAGKTVLFFSLEMSKEELVQRIIAAEARVELQKIRTGDLTSSEWMEIKAVREKIEKGTFLIDASPKMNISKIRSIISRQKQRPEGLDMVIIDYLQLMETTSTRKNDNRQQEVSELSRNIKLLAKEMDIPIIILSQLNRNSESRLDRVPQVSDLRESGSLEQDADMVLLIHRPEVADENNRPNETDLIIGKQRSGPTGKIPLVAMLAFSKFAPGQGIVQREPEMLASDNYSATDDETPW